MDDQHFGGGMQFRRFVDRQGKGLRHRQPVVVFGRRVMPGIEQPRRRRGETSGVFGEPDFQPLAIGRRLLMRQWQPAQRLGQILGRLALRAAAGARDQELGADLLGPDPDLDRLGQPAPGIGVRGDQHPRRPAARQIGKQRIGIDRIVEDQQDAVALMPQPLADRGQGRRFLLVRGDPAEPHPERRQIGAQRRLGLGPDPPGRAIIAAVQLGIGRRQYRLADPAQPVQRGDRHPGIAAPQYPVDIDQRVVAPEEMLAALEPEHWREPSSAPAA